MCADLVTVTEPRSPSSEAYRSLRTNLEFASLDRPLRTLLVISAGPEQGKSIVLANLAVVMAQAGKRVILVDADLRRPQQHEIFGIDNTHGLTTVLYADSTPEALPLAETVLTGLRVLTSGPLAPNPAELLASRRLVDLIAALTAQADLVLFDAPPIIAMTDAAILAGRVDGVLLVVNARETRRDHAQRAKDLLERVNARLLGAVLNNVPFDVSLQRYYN